MQPNSNISNTIPNMKSSPFWYGSFSGLWIYYAVEINVLNKMLGASGLTAFPFGDLKGPNGEAMGLVNFNFMTYSSDSGMNNPASYADINNPITYNDAPPPNMGVEPTHECELNIVSYASTSRSLTDRVPFGMTSSQFIAGKDQTKTIGNYRVWVPCDDRIAVYWGMHNFGENKVMTHPFTYNVPAPNNPGGCTWKVSIPAPMDEPASSTLFSFKVADLANTPGVVSADPSSIIDFSLYPHSATNPATQRVVGSRRNIFGQFNCMTKKSVKKAGVKMPGFKLKIGDSNHPMVADLYALFGSGTSFTPAGLMTYATPPVIAESPLYYADV